MKGRMVTDSSHPLPGALRFGMFFHLLEALSTILLNEGIQSRIQLVLFTLQRERERGREKERERERGGERERGREGEREREREMSRVIKSNKQ